MWGGQSWRQAGILEAAEKLFHRAMSLPENPTVEPLPSVAAR